MTTPRDDLPDPEDSAIVARILAGMALDAALDRFKGLFEGQLYRVMETTVGTLNAVTGIGFNIPDVAARRIIAAGGSSLVGMDIEGQTRRSLFAALAESRKQGLAPSSSATRKLIQEHVTAGRFVNAGPKYRAKLIARTETMRAQNLSTLEAYDKAEAVQSVIAVDNQTGFGDADCTARDGNDYPVDEAKRILADEHPNGTLQFLPLT